ncbi:MAG TPA: YheC/YheD family protein [Bacillus bacterium]|nr:YheC/YheD family protein [Bacillus sp. (in: firmicutes)]
MLSFGFLTLNKKTEQGYFIEIAKRAASQGMEVFCFSPGDIDPNTEYVHGTKFNPTTNAWDRAVFPIPTFIYDRCFYSSEEIIKKYSPIVNWLKNRKDLFFIGHGLPNKWKLYNTLSSHSLLKYYIPITRKVENSEDIFKALNKHKKILLKPENGSQGRGIILLMMKGKQIELQTHRNKNLIHKVFSKKERLSHWLKQLVRSHSYLVQEYLPLLDEEMRPFDIRILLQKKKDNDWHELGRGIRKGQKGHCISNLHGGGTAYSFEEWLQSKSFDKAQRELLLDDLNTITTHLPTALEASFERPLFELGIDIGFAKDGSTWILDTNSKPGHKTILQTNPGIEEFLYSAPIDYCKQIALQRKELI